MSAKLNSIQVARALAAGIVVMLHSYQVTNNLSVRGLGLPSWLAWGYAGVDIFFVISGFIICLVTDRANISAGDFLYKRLYRILPFYWVFTVAWAILATLAGKEIGNRGLIMSLVLLPPQLSGLVLGVAWSLEQEFVFYGIVAALILVRQMKALPWVLGALFVIGLVWHVNAPDLWDYRLVSLYHFQFLLGVLLYRFRNAICEVWWVWLLGIGIAGLFMSGWVVGQLYPDHVSTLPLGWPGVTRVVMFGTFGAVFLAGLIAWEKQRPKDLVSALGRGVVLLGNASFAWYLSHPIIFAVAGVALSRAGLGERDVWFAASASIAFSAAFAIVWYCFVEAPFMHWVHARGRRTAAVAAG